METRERQFRPPCLEWTSASYFLWKFKLGFKMFSNVAANKEAKTYQNFGLWKVTKNRCLKWCIEVILKHVEYNLISTHKWKLHQPEKDNWIFREVYLFDWNVYLAPNHIPNYTMLAKSKHGINYWWNQDNHGVVMFVGLKVSIKADASVASFASRAQRRN